MKAIKRIKNGAQLRTCIGIGLMVLSAAAMLLWETGLRSRVAFRSVLVCARDIEAGEILSSEDLSAAEVTPQSMISGALSGEDAGQVIGLAALYPMKKNQQVSEDMFGDGAERPELSSFVIPDEWIWSESILDREGDTVAFYMIDTGDLLGRFRISVEAGSGSSLEVLCTLQDFLMIRAAALEAGERCILIVGEGKR